MLQRKGRLTKSASSAGPGKSVDGEEEGGGEEEDQAMEAPEAKQQGSSNSIDVEEENSSPQEDPSGTDSLRLRLAFWWSWFHRVLFCCLL